MSTAYFVKWPKTILELEELHDLRAEQPFEIVDTITLPIIDFGNFIFDLSVERYFLDHKESLCEWRMKTIRCLLVQVNNLPGGILVVPTQDSRVRLAAVAPNSPNFSLISF